MDDWHFDPPEPPPPDYPGQWAMEMARDRLDDEGEPYTEDDLVLEAERIADDA